VIEPENKTVDAILDRALQGYNISTADALVLLQQKEPKAIASIQTTADLLRRRQSGDTVTYVINHNINFTNICEQHCSFCAFRRDEGDQGAFWLNADQILEKATDAVQRGATEICMRGGSSRRCGTTDYLPGKNRFGNLARNCGNCSQFGITDNEYNALRAY